MCSNLLKLACDTKLFRQVTSCEEADKLQRYLNTTHGWSVEWLTLLNADNCECVNYGHNNRQYDYFMGDEPIETLHEEKDLGVIITDRLEATKQQTY